MISTKFLNVPYLVWQTDQLIRAFVAELVYNVWLHYPTAEKSGLSAEAYNMGKWLRELRWKETEQSQTMYDFQY
jgi:hypothetical protein